jgi:Fe-S oxidoreductase
VILFADTFNDHFLPETLWAGVDVLERAGFQVVVPMQNLCCGRPLYDYGFLPHAIRNLQTILDTLRPAIQAGIPMVVLEPSCAAVFRDELTNLFPVDHDAHRLAQQTFLLSEFLTHQAKDFAVPGLDRPVLLHGHCHQKSIMGLGDEKQVIGKLSKQVMEPEDGCCGMAGAFGYETGDHYDVSIKCGERVLLPKVREVDERTVIVADGFSCREQIHQETDRHALHLAEVLQMAAAGTWSRDGEPPEGPVVRARQKAQRRASIKTGAALTMMAAASAMAVWMLRKRKRMV